MARTALYFDIGNTNTKVGIRTDQKDVSTYTLPTGDKLTSDKFGLMLLDLLNFAKIPKEEVDFCLASSVVPAMSNIISQACKRFLNCTLHLAPGDLDFPLENRYARPYEVGADRLVGAYAARCLFPDVPSIISVDYGTATTFDCVEGNAYLGGLICPGIFSSAAALAGATAKLPSIDLKLGSVELEPGRSTATSLNQGFVFGFAAMTEGLVKKLARKMAGPVVVIGTGGFAESLKSVTDCFDTVWPDLVLEGLARLHDSL